MNKFFRKIEPYLYLMPTLIGLVVFSAGAIIISFAMSFTEWQIIRPPEWVGLQNYIDIFESEFFLKIFWNTLYFVLLNLPLSIILPLLIAIALNQKLWGMKFFRTIYFLPVISSMVAVALVWSWLYRPEYGLLNYILNKLFGITGPRWLENQSWAMPAIVLMSAWKNIGYNMVIFLAGLQNIPQALYEVSDIEGAKPWQKFFRITVPLLSPTIFFVTIITLISSFQVFEQTYILTKGGPANSTLTLSYYIFQNAFMYFRMGSAAALSYVLFAIIFIITMIQFKLQKKWVHYN